MKHIVKSVLFILFLSSTINANTITTNQLTTGEKVFRAYCWGCHHQTSEAFGPSFQEIANKRSIGEIQGHIVSPKSTYEQLGHKRSVMPAFGDTLSQKELDLITNFILSFKGNN